MKFTTTALLLCAAASWTLIAASPAAAQMGGSMPSSSSSSSSHASSNKPHLSKALGADIIAAQKMIQAKDDQGAIAKLKTLQPTATDPYDIYVINRLLFAAAVDMNDMATAGPAIEAAVASPAMPDEDKKSMVYNALQVSANLQQWPQAIQYGQELVQLNGIDARATGILAIAYYNTKDFAHAQQYAQQSVDLAKAAGQPPDQNALQIIEGSQVNQHNQAGAEQTLEQIALQNPTPQIWAELIQHAFGGIRDAEALYLYRLLQITGAMTGEDYKEYGSDTATLGYPTETVNVLQQGISAGKISASEVGPTLTKARRDAQTDERSLPQIAASAQKSKSGEQEVKLGEDYWGYGRYADVEAAAREAVTKGGLKTPWEGPMLIGAAQVAQSKYADAVQTLSQVSGSAGVTKVAHLWSLYAQSKQGGAHAAATPPAQTPSQ
jgi:hypothetical protein